MQTYSTIFEPIKQIKKSFAKRARAEHRTDSTELIPKSTRPNNIAVAGIYHQKYDDEYTGFAMKSWNMLNDNDDPESQRLPLEQER